MCNYCAHLSVCIAHLSCSDGMSRSGVFITCMTEIERVKVEGGVDIFQTVKAARAQRPFMVNTSVSTALAPGTLSKCFCQTLHCTIFFNVLRNIINCVCINTHWIRYCYHTGSLLRCYNQWTHLEKHILMCVYTLIKISSPGIIYNNSKYKVDHFSFLLSGKGSYCSNNHTIHIFIYMNGFEILYQKIIKCAAIIPFSYSHIYLHLYSI